MAEKRERVVLEIVGGTAAVATEAGSSPPGGAGPGDGEDQPRPVWCSDDALAAELVADLGEDWCFASSGDWFVWDGKRWEQEKLKRVWNRSRRVCRRVAVQLTKSEKLARQVSSSSTIHAVVRLAQTDPAVTVRVEQFDDDIWLLNTLSGIVDLRTGQLYPHDRDRRMTRICAAAPVAAGTAGGGCPHWQKFLRDSTGKDPAFENYLQRITGYLLTGSIEEHAIFFLYGPGGTGKSTYQKVLSELLADYATTAMMDLFTVTVGERHPTELATLLGRRLVIAGEVDGAKRWDEAKLKAITGGDRISARFMRGDPFTFAPQFKLLLAGNDRPRMRGADDAMRRRFHVIPFRFKPLVVDKELDEKLRTELPGILAWAIEGEIRRRMLGGLNPPKVIQDATDEYFQTENVLGRWVDERCVKDVQEFSLTRDLYRDFKSWAAMAGEYPLSERLFSQKLAMLPDLKKELHPATRQSGFRGLAPLHREEDLFSAFGGAGRAGAGGVGHAGSGRRGPSDPDDPMNDPAEDWPRE